MPVGVLNVAALALLRAAAQQDQQHVTVHGEVNAIARAEVDLALTDPSADWLDVREVSVFQPSDGRPHLQSRRSVQLREPRREQALPIFRLVLDDFDRIRS